MNIIISIKNIKFYINRRLTQKLIKSQIKNLEKTRVDEKQKKNNITK